MYSFSNEVKNSNLNCEYFKKDDLTTSTTVDIASATADSALGIRKGWVAESKPLILSIVPYIDLMSTNHFLCPGHKVSLEFERTRSTFSLLAPTAKANAYKIKILDLVLWTRVLEPLPSIANILEKSKSSGLVQYPLTRNVIRTYQVHSGISRIKLNNIFRGILP